MPFTHCKTFSVIYSFMTGFSAISFQQTFKFRFYEFQVKHLDLIWDPWKKMEEVFQTPQTPFQNLLCQNLIQFQGKVSKKKMGWFWKGSAIQEASTGAAAASSDSLPILTGFKPDCCSCLSSSSMPWKHHSRKPRSGM